MIQDINPHKFDLTYGQPKAQDEDFVLYIKKSKTLLRKVDEENHKIPKFSDFPEDKELLKESAYYLFAIDGNHYYYVTEMPRYDSDVYELCSTAAYRKMHPMYQAFAGITATQIHRFKESRKYCGRCGHLMENSKTERALVCPECGQTEYPKISPAVIVAISDGDRLLMSRYRVNNNPYRGYALIAGFVEIGESFEETIHREVMEEVGLKVKNIRYYKSQPWGFDQNLLLGYFCELDGERDIVLDTGELATAEWVHYSDVPEDPEGLSLTREMMSVFQQKFLSEKMS